MSIDPKSLTAGQKRWRKAEPFLTGGFSACFASFCVQPIDLVKTRIQVLGKGANASPIFLTKQVIQQEGFFKLYAGLSASLLRQAIYGTCRLGLHRVFSDYLKERNGGKMTFWQSTFSGLASGAIAGMIGNPFDISMVRMQADGLQPPELRRGYKNVFHALYRIVRDEGLFTLWRGCLPMICRAMAMNVGMLASYDQAKQLTLKFMNPGIAANLLCSAISGFCCALTSLPFDMMKTRLMSMKPDAEGKMPYKGLTDAFLKTVKSEGIFSLWKGFWTYYFRCAPHAMIILLTNEAIIPSYQKFFYGGRLVKN
ncbi:hypothetical protein WA158_003674 [Blastocystis sp. Blastoise]